MNAKCWAVSYGSYSDYRVLAIFATKAQAERACRLRGDDDYGRGERVEEMVFYPKGTEAVISTEYHQNVELMDDGTTTTRGLQTETQPEFGHLYGLPPLRPTTRYVRAPIHKNLGGRLEVRGSDAASVQQVVSDWLAEWRANPELFALAHGKRKQAAS